MKLWLRFFALWITVLLLCLPFSSCKSSEDESAPDNTPKAETFFGLEIPEGTNLGGKTIGVLTTATAEGKNSYQINPENNPLFSVESASATVNALSECVRLVEQRLGVKIEEEVVFTTNRYGGDMYQRIVTDAMSFTAEYAFCMPCLIEGGMLAAEGLLYDMGDVVDLKREWWCQPFNDALTIDGCCYMAAGDIGVVGRDATLFVAFNKKMAESYHITQPYGYDSLYDMVYNNAWTQDVMFEMAKSVYSDTNHNNRCDLGDTNGLSGQVGMVYWLLKTGGENICENDSNGYPQLVVKNERALELIQKAQDYLQDPKSGFICADDYFNMSSVPVAEVIVPEFKGDRCLFFMNALMNLDLIRDMESDFGVLPCPMFDSDQGNYCSNVGAWSASAVCVPTSTPEEELAELGLIIDALGAVSLAKLTPVYYEQTLQYQITRDEESMKMLDIIFANRTPDLAETFRWGDMQKVVTNMITAPAGSFVSAYEKAEQATIAAIEETVNAFRENKNKS